jgi:hypothetical protein
MTSVAEASQLVTFRDGTTASLAVLERLWAIEARGGTFVPTNDGGFRVEPSGRMTPSEQAFLRTHRDEARRLVRYQADDSHLTDTVTGASR